MKIVQKQIFSTSFFLLIALSAISQSKYTINGYVKEEESGELLPGVTVYIPSLKTGVSTNSYGFYSLTLPKGKYEIKFSFIGFDTKIYEAILDKDIVKNVFIRPVATALDEIVIVAETEPESKTSQMSLIKLPVESVADIPSLFGEKDILKVIQLMPGVQSGSEGSAGLYIRGGGQDQNLIILDDATVYNAYHLFGFFSVFNGDAIKSVELYKGGFPARFGGRLSSVIKMGMKEGNKNKLQGKASIGLLSSSATLEGPIIKGKTSFSINGRRTYFDLLTMPFQTGAIKAGYFFYDFNAKVNHEFSDTDKLYISGYFGKDKFHFKDNQVKESAFNSQVDWGNYTTTARWNHQFGKRLFSNTSIIFSKYAFSIKASETSGNDKFSASYISSIRDYSLKYDIDYFPTPYHSIKFGAMTTTHKFVPNAFVVKEGGATTENNTTSFHSLESAIYLEDDMKILSRININAGIRLAHFTHKKETYLDPEPRLSIGYQLLPNTSVKASYTSMNQYIHLLSNSGIGLPTDLWVSSTSRVKPQSSQQVAVGIARDFPKEKLTLTVEGYYKKSKNVISYKEGADFLQLEIEDDENLSAEEVSWEDNITSGNAFSYGIEVFLQKKQGKFTGWLGYTLSRAEMQFDEKNLGKKFLAKYDRTHDISLVGIYKESPKVTLSGTWVYGTGNNYTLPIANYRTIENSFHSFDSDNSLGSENSYGYHYEEQRDYGEINSFRASAYHRLDLGIQFHKKRKRGLRTWEFAIYNVYNRKNPFYYYISNGSSRNSKTELTQISIFPIIPSFKYTLEF